MSYAFATLVRPPFLLHVVYVGVVLHVFFAEREVKDARFLKRKKWCAKISHFVRCTTEGLTAVDQTLVLLDCISASIVLGKLVIFSIRFCVI
jgi:hypothetical protein